MHKSQVLFYLLVAFVVGVFVASVFVVSYTAVLVLLILGILVIAVAGYNGTFGDSEKGIKKRKIAVLAGFVLLVFAFGAARFDSFQYSHTLLEQTADRNVKIAMRGYMAGETNTSGKAANFKFKVKQIQIGDRLIDTDENILVVTEKFPARKFGEALIVVGAPQTPKNFSSFDYVTYLKKEGVKVEAVFPKIQTSDQSGAGKVENWQIKVKAELFDIKNSFQAAVDK